MEQSTNKAGHEGASSAPRFCAGGEQIMGAVAKWLSTTSVKRPLEPSAGPALQSSGHSYLSLLMAEYESLLGDVHSKNPRAVQMAEEVKARVGRGEASWDDVHKLEVALLELQPFEELARRAWALRVDYRSMIGDRLFNEYLRSLPDGINTNERLLRADLRRVSAELHRYWTIERAENESRKANLILALLGFFGVLILSLVTPALFILVDGMGTGASAGAIAINSWLREPTEWLFRMAALFGSIGGLVSVMQRIKGAQSADVKSLELLPAWPIALAPIMGAVGGLLICLLFESGFLKGSLFPAFEPGGQATLADPELYKLLIWAFVAGFSEKLVPDTLDWLASNALPKRLGQGAETGVSNSEMGLGHVSLEPQIAQLKRKDQLPGGHTNHRPLP
jgi:hypothetical protein